MKHRAPDRSNSAALCALLLMFTCVACQTPLHHDLDEAEANTIALTLEQSGVAAYKTRDPSNDSRWSVAVDEGQQRRAWEILKEYGLPRARNAGSNAGLMGLIPTPGEEREARLRRTAQQLEASLMTTPGVVNARIHLVAPPIEPLAAARLKAKPNNTASVLLKVRSDVDPPVDPQAMARMISGAVPDLDTQDVHITTSTARLPTVDDAHRWTALGPWRVAAGSYTTLQGLLVALLAIILFQSGVIAYLLARARKTTRP